MKHRLWIESIKNMFDELDIDSFREIIEETDIDSIIADSDQIFSVTVGGLTK